MLYILYILYNVLVAFKSKKHLFRGKIEQFYNIDTNSKLLRLTNNIAEESSNTF